MSVNGHLQTIVWKCTRFKLIEGCKGNYSNCFRSVYRPVLPKMYVRLTALVPRLSPDCIHLLIGSVPALNSFVCSTASAPIRNCPSPVLARLLSTHSRYFQSHSKCELLDNRLQKIDGEPHKVCNSTMWLSKYA